MGSDYLFSSENSIWASVEDKIRNHRLTDINHNMISGGYEHEVRCKRLLFQHGHRLRGAADPLGYADLILNGEPEEYLKNVAGSHGLED